MRASNALKLTVVPMLLLAACGGGADSTSASVALKPKITISSTNDPTSQLLTEIYGQALEKAEFRVARKKAYDTPEALYEGVVAGDVQLTGTTSQALLAALAIDPVPNPTTQQVEAITAALPTTSKIGAVSTAEDKDVIVCAKAFADSNSLVTLTDLGVKSATARLAAPEGFDTASPMGAGGLKDLYKAEFQSIVPTPIDKVLEAVTAGTADCGMARSGDFNLATGDYTVLQDDKALVPNDVILPLVAGDGTAADVVAVLDATSIRLTTDQLRLLNLRMKKDGAPPEVVANEFIGNVGT